MRQLFFRIFVNNFITNFFIRAFGLEKAVYHSSNPYLSFNASEIRSTQENAGYSNRPEINEVLNRSKNDLRSAVNEFCTEDGRILDIGCGPGMYLELFKDSPYKLYATDINDSMLAYAKKNVPQANCMRGNFLDIQLTLTFNFIYCIGVLIYIPKQNIKEFFKKIYDSLEPEGIFYLNYPHALSWLDTVYQDLTYIQYSPLEVERIAGSYFKILKHEHAFDARKIGAYDTQPYKSLNPNTHRTYKNSYLLIVKKTI